MNAVSQFYQDYFAMTRHPFSIKIIECIRAIPFGKVATYGQIAVMAGNPRGARQVSRILHSCTQSENLPWHRVVNKKGRISLDPFLGGEEQKKRLEQEGIEFDLTQKINLEQYLWQPESASDKNFHN